MITVFNTEPERQACLLAVDGGASHCRIAAYAAKGDMLGSFTLDRAASLSVGVRNAVESVRSVIHVLEGQLGASLEGVPLLCGLAGALREARKADFLAAIGAERRVDVVTDGHAQLLGVAGGEPGVCLAVGTGSVVHWLCASGECGFAGGWGYPVADEGSAAWLGMRALRGYVHRLDSGAVMSDFWLAVAERVGRDIESIQEWTTCTRSSQVATLAPLVTHYAASGDAEAESLLHAGVDACEQLFAHAPEDLPRWLVGGLAEVYRPHLLARGCELREARGDALSGLYIHARRQAWV